MDNKLDVTGAYPTNELALNVSKETTTKEIISVEGVDEHTRRMATINYSAGQTNAIEFCQQMYKLPSMIDLLEAYDASRTVERIPSPREWVDLNIGGLMRKLVKVVLS